MNFDQKKEIFRFIKRTYNSIDNFIDRMDFLKEIHSTILHIRKENNIQDNPDFEVVNIDRFYDIRIRHNWRPKKTVYVLEKSGLKHEIIKSKTLNNVEFLDLKVLIERWSFKKLA